MAVNGELVTVLMANYNHARFISYAVESVAAQTYKPLQFVFVDDASTDNSREVIDRLHAKLKTKFSGGFQVFPRTERGNLNQAINSGWNFVEGRYISLFDADDGMLPEFVERTLSHLKAARAKDKKIGFVYTDNYKLLEDGTRSRHMGAYPFSKARLFGRGMEAKSYIAGNAMTVTPALGSVMPLPLETVEGEKHLRWKRIVSNGWKGAYLPEPLFEYRMVKGQMSGVGEKVEAAEARGDTTIPGMRINIGDVWPVHNDRER